MTLITSQLNEHQAILISDRRLTVNGRLVDDESNKAATFFCEDARLAMAFTGVARAGKFETSRTLLDILLRASQAEHLLSTTIPRFVELLTEEIGKANIPAVSRHLTVVFAGYTHQGSLVRPVLCQVTNAFDESGAQVSTAGKFIVRWAKDPLGLYGFGMKRGVSSADQNALRELLARGKPARAIVDKGVDAIRKAAQSASSSGLVGMQCTSIVLPVDPRSAVTAEYHSFTVKNKIYLPSAVVSTRNASFWNEGARVEQWDSTGAPRPLSVRKVGRNQPCPCGSGEKYKRCHGSHS
jgi:hypothetical protein